MNWVLILFMSIGAMSDKDSMALTSVPMANEQACHVAGKAAVVAFDKGTKSAKYVCVRNQ